MHNHGNNRCHFCCCCCCSCQSLSPMNTLLGNNNAAARLKTINNEFLLCCFTTRLNCSNNPIRSNQKFIWHKQAKLDQFSAKQTKTGQGVHQNYMHNMIQPLDCTVIPRDSLIKKTFCWDLLLGQTYSLNFTVHCIPLAVLTQQKRR